MTCHAFFFGREPSFLLCCTFFCCSYPAVGVLFLVWFWLAVATPQEEELSELGRGVMLYRRLGLEFEGGDLGEDGSMKSLRLVFRQVCMYMCTVTQPCACRICFLRKPQGGPAALAASGTCSLPFGMLVNGILRGLLYVEIHPRCNKKQRIAEACASCIICTWYIFG